MDHHLTTGEPGNSRNGYGKKTVTTDTGRIELEIPRDRQSSFNPQLIAKYKRHFPGFDENRLHVCARHERAGDRRTFARSLPRGGFADLIGAVTDAVLDEVAAWQGRPLEAVYPIVFFDALRQNPRQGARPQQGRSRRSGHPRRRNQGNYRPWLEQNKGAKFWLRVMNELKNRGVKDILIAVIDGLKGSPEAILSVFPEAQVQTCIVHLLRNSLDFVSYKDRKAVAAALKTIYRADDATAGEAALAAFEASEWGKKYPAIGQSWRRAWGEVVPFFAFHPDVRRLITPPTPSRH